MDLKEFLLMTAAVALGFIIAHRVSKHLNKNHIEENEWESDFETN